MAVANYEHAEGRTATVQVATERDGVLGTRSVQLGAETGPYPTDLLFEVIIEQDSLSGTYTARLGD